MKESSRGRSRLLGLWLGLLLSAGFPGGARAAPPADGQPGGPDLTDLSLKELLDIDLVYGASRYRQKTSEAPSSVTIVTAQDIQAFGYNTLADILAGVSGLYTRYDRVYSYTGVRGFQRTNDYNLRVLLLVDGHRLNDNIYNSALIGTEGVINVDAIERVEVIRGPSSSIYGTGAFFAVINVVTRSGRQVDGAEASAAAGSWHTGTARLAWGDRSQGGAEAYVDGSASGSSGQTLFYPEFNDPLNPLSANGGRAVDVDDDRSYRVLAKAAFGHFGVEVAHSDRRKELPTAPYGTLFNDPDNRTEDARSFFDFRYQDDLGAKKKTNLMARLYADRYAYQGDFDYDALSGGHYTENAYGYTRGLEVQATIRPNDSNTLLAGGEFRDHNRQDFYAQDDIKVYLDAHRSSDDYAVFVQDQFVPSRHLIVNVGVRHDRYQSFGGSTNPRLGVIYTPVDRTVLKFLYGHAFRAPSAQELYYGNGANPDLDAETIRTSEFVLEQRIAASMRLSATYYHNTTQGLISLNGALTLFENLGSTTTDGSELSLEQRLPRGTQWRFDYAVQDTRVDATGDHLDDSPRHLMKFHLTQPIRGEKLSAGLEATYTGGRITLAGDGLGGYTLVNLTLLSRNLARGLDLSGSIYNLLDKSYADPASFGYTQDAIPQDGRHYRIKLTWRF